MNNEKKDKKRKCVCCGQELKENNKSANFCSRTCRFKYFITEIGEFITINFNG